MHHRCRTPFPPSASARASAYRKNCRRTFSPGQPAALRYLRHGTYLQQAEPGWQDSRSAGPATWAAEHLRFNSPCSRGPERCMRTSQHVWVRAAVGALPRTPPRHVCRTACSPNTNRPHRQRSGGPSAPSPAQTSLSAEPNRLAIWRAPEGESHTERNGAKRREHRLGLSLGRPAETDSPRCEASRACVRACVRATREITQPERWPDC